MLAPKLLQRNIEMLRLLCFITDSTPSKIIRTYELIILITALFGVITQLIYVDITLLAQFQSASGILVVLGGLISVASITAKESQVYVIFEEINEAFDIKKYPELIPIENINRFFVNFYMIYAVILAGCIEVIPLGYYLRTHNLEKLIMYKTWLPSYSPFWNWFSLIYEVQYVYLIGLSMGMCPLFVLCASRLVAKRLELLQNEMDAFDFVENIEDFRVVQTRVVQSHQAIIQ